MINNLCKVSNKRNMACRRTLDEVELSQRCRSPRGNRTCRYGNSTNKVITRADLCRLGRRRRRKKEEDACAAVESSAEIQARWGVVDKVRKENDGIWPACEK